MAGWPPFPTCVPGLQHSCKDKDGKVLQDPRPDPQQPPQALPPSSGAVLPQHTACSDDDIVSIPRKKRPLEPHDGKTPGTATAGKEGMLRGRQKTEFEGGRGGMGFVRCFQHHTGGRCFGSSALEPDLIPGWLLKVTQTGSRKEEIWRILVKCLSMKAIPGWLS